jgi:hypothetical protein
VVRTRLCRARKRRTVALLIHVAAFFVRTVLIYFARRTRGRDEIAITRAVVIRARILRVTTVRFDASLAVISVARHRLWICLVLQVRGARVAFVDATASAADGTRRVRIATVIADAGVGRAYFRVQVAYVVVPLWTNKARAI